MRLCGVILTAAAAMIAAISCVESSETPRGRVLEFVKLVQVDTIPDIGRFVDLDSVAAYEYADERYDTLSVDDKKRLLLRGFRGMGEYRGVWAKAQVIVNDEIRVDDTTALVEVSFIDRSTRVQYLTQMVLKQRRGVWVITNFKSN